LTIRLNIAGSKIAHRDIGPECLDYFPGPVDDLLVGQIPNGGRSPSVYKVSGQLCTVGCTASLAVARLIRHWIPDSCTPLLYYRSEEGSVAVLLWESENECGRNWDEYYSQLLKTSVARTLCLCLMAFRSPTRGQEWRNSIRKMNWIPDSCTPLLYYRSEEGSVAVLLWESENDPEDEYYSQLLKTSVARTLCLCLMAFRSPTRGQEGDDGGS
jgi:hypothetical protein